MTTRLIDLDDELPASAQCELHTTGISDTVRAALRLAANAAARARQVTWLREAGLEAMTDPARTADVVRIAGFLIDTSAVGSRPGRPSTATSFACRLVGH